MIQVIAGNKGSGKTKRLLDITNDALKQEHGQIVFIDDDKRYMYDLRHEIRFVDAGEFAGIKGCSADVFLGFLAGMLAGNYDISLICVDAFVKLIKGTDLKDTAVFFRELENLSQHSNCSFILNVSCDLELLPEHIKPYVI